MFYKVNSTCVTEKSKSVSRKNRNREADQLEKERKRRGGRRKVVLEKTKKDRKSQGKDDYASVSFFHEGGAKVVKSGTQQGVVVEWSEEWSLVPDR